MVDTAAHIPAEADTAATAEVDTAAMAADTGVDMEDTAAVAAMVEAAVAADTASEVAVGTEEGVEVDMLTEGKNCELICAASRRLLSQTSMLIFLLYFDYNLFS
jgi:hypothetical protein